MPAKIIVKSGYIKNVQHMVNALYYAGNKIEAQIAVMEDGSTVEAGSVDMLVENQNFARIQVTLTNGRTINLTPEQYRKKVNEHEKLQDEQILHWEDGEKVFQAEGYIKYIAYRKSVEKAPNQKHGLFTLDGDADIPQEQEKLREHQDSVMWSHIISLERADAERTGYDNRSAWRNLVTAKSLEFGKLYNIDPKNLVVNAAYHDKDHHPHLHLYFYSTDPREGVVKDMGYASTKLKSLFFNEIFKGDVQYLKEVRTDQRSQLEARLEELLRSIQKQSYRPPKEVCDKLLELSVALQDYKGKNVYAFHSPEIKEQVDELVESMVKTDRHLAHLFDIYLHTQRTFAEQYQQDPAKIAARMQEFTEHFFHPRPAQRGRPGTGDRVVLHNKVLRYAKVLNESVLTQPPQLPSKPKKQAVSGTTAKKKQSAEEILNSEVYGALRASVKAGEAPRPLENEVSTLYNEIKDDEFATAYSYVPLNAKAETRELLHRMADASEPFRDALQAYLQKLQKDFGNPEITLDQMEKKFFDPGWRDDRRLHNTIVRFTKKLEEQRAVINYNSKVFFTLPDTFRENGDQELLAKLTELNSLIDTIPNEELNFRELENPVKEKITGMLAGILNNKKEIQIPEEVKTALLNPDELTPVTFQNTIVKFAKKLEQHRAVTEHSHEVYAALSDSFAEESSPLLQSLEQLHTLAKNIPPEKLSYYEQDIDLRAPANGILKQVFETGDVHVPDNLRREFLSPDELTPMGFQNTILRVAKKLPIHRAVAQLRQTVFSFLLESLDDTSENPALRGQLAELHDLLFEIPNDELHFRKLDEPAREQIQEILAEILNSNEEIHIADEVKQELFHPDELTPLGLQNIILRVAKKPDEYRAINAVRSNLFILLSKDIERQTGNALQLKKLGESFQAILPEDFSHRKLNAEQQKAVADILARALADAGIPEKTLKSLLNPDELTPLSLQNMVIYFADQYEQYKLAASLQKDLFMGLLRTTDGKSPLRQGLLALQGELRKAGDVSYPELPKEVQEKVNTLLRKLLKDHPAAKQHAELLAELFSPDKRTPTGLQNTVMRFACRYDEYIKRQIHAKAKYTAKLLLRSCAYSLAKLARENERYHPSEPEQQSNLTEKRPVEAWRNYKEPKYQSYD